MSESSSQAVLPLIEALLNGTIDDAAFARLEAILREDVQARALYRSMMNLHSALPGLVGRSPKLSIQLLDEDGQSALEPHEMPHARLVSLMAQIESQGEDLDPMALAAERFPKAQPQATTRQDWFNAGRYAISIAKAYRQQAIMGAAAAVMLFAAVSLLVWDSAQDRTEPLAHGPLFVEPGQDDAPQPNAPVATLTATQDAQWASDFDYGTPENGDSFRPGRRLKLLAGFAEITTNLNARVLLEGPCDITFGQTTSDLRLQQGKLSASVPPKAVGFTIHTPKAKVIDYGTRFGVEVLADGTTHAAVFTGEIELSEAGHAPGQPTRNVRLTKGWASSVSSEGVLSRAPRQVTAQDESRFVQSIDQASDPALAYRRAVMASAPLLYWGFDEGGTTTRNLAGDTALRGQAIGQTTSTQGLFGSALQLSGTIESAGGFVCSNPVQLAGLNEYTIEAWCWIDRPHHGRVVTLAMFDTAEDRYSQSVGLIELLDGQDMPPTLRDFAPATRFMHHADNSDSVAIKDHSLFGKPATPKQWVHLVAVRTASQASLYLNGQLVSKTSESPKAGSQQQAGLFVGTAIVQLDSAELKPHDLRPFAGRIDEVALYSTALSEQTIQNHFQLGRPVDEGQLLP